MQLQPRVVNLLTNPTHEWRIIAAEPTDVPTLFREYIAVLAAIPPVCTFIGYSIVGVTAPYMGGTIRTTLLRGIVGAIVSYALALVATYVDAIIIEKLAPSFGSTASTVQALKLVAYASTPFWVAGVLNVLPPLSTLIIIAAAYSIYLLYLGVSPVMHTPENQVIPYMVVAAVVVFAVWIIFAMVAASIAGVGAVAGYRTF
jgi:hypothetical protein